MLILAILVASTFGVVANAQDELGTIPEVAAATEGLGTLVGALDLADPAAVEALSGEGPLTIFAPQDDAFATMDADMMNTALSDTEVLTNILYYHVVPGEWTSEALLAEIEASEEGPAELETVLGEPLVVSLDEDGNVLVNGVLVVTPDVMASNGVIHVIDSVLVPPSMMGVPPSYVMEVEPGEMGSEDNPLVLLFIPSERAEEVQAGAEELAVLLNQKTGLVFEASVSTDYAAAIEALCSGEAEMAALNTFGYVLASQRGCAEVGVVSVRFGSTFYQGQIITLEGSGIESYADLAGTTFCRPDPLSTSGWIIPSIAIQANGLDLEDDLEVIDAGGHDGVVQAVYNGECDAGATFVDARTQVEEELTDVMDKVVVIELSAPIPNDTLSFSTDVADEVKANIVSALVEISQDEAQREVLTAVYSWEELVPAEDAFFDDFREQLDAAGIDIEALQ
jgi:phosphonate transport system substrate-binding protein